MITSTSAFTQQYDERVIHTHHDIGLAWRLPLAHVPAHDSDMVRPSFAADHVAQSYDSVGVFVEGEDANGDATALGSLERKPVR